LRFPFKQKHRISSQTRQRGFYLTLLQNSDMTIEEIEESQSVIEDGGMGGPGAPTPLSALEVGWMIAEHLDLADVHVS
jgi:hypothetical protein